MKKLTILLAILIAYGQAMAQPKEDNKATGWTISTNLDTVKAVIQVSQMKRPTWETMTDLPCSDTCKHSPYYVSHFRYDTVYYQQSTYPMYILFGYAVVSWNREEGKLDTWYWLDDKKQRIKDLIIWNDHLVNW